jgi:hypothetical protein
VDRYYGIWRIEGLGDMVNIIIQIFSCPANGTTGSEERVVYWFWGFVGEIRFFGVICLVVDRIGEGEKIFFLDCDQIEWRKRSKKRIQHPSISGDGYEKSGSK